MYTYKVNKYSQKYVTFKLKIEYRQFSILSSHLHRILTKYHHKVICTRTIYFSSFTIRTDPENYKNYCHQFLFPITKQFQSRLFVTTGETQKREEVSTNNNICDENERFNKNLLDILKFEFDEQEFTNRKLSKKILDELTKDYSKPVTPMLGCKEYETFLDKYPELQKI